MLAGLPQCSSNHAAVTGSFLPVSSWYTLQGIEGYSLIAGLLMVSVLACRTAKPTHPWSSGKGTKIGNNLTASRTVRVKTRDLSPAEEHTAGPIQHTSDRTSRDRNFDFMSADWA